MPGNFSFILPGQLAGCAQPGRFSDLAADLSALSAQGIGAIVTLTERPLDAALLGDAGFRWLHLPMADFTPPGKGQIRDFVRFVDECLADDIAVVVHCGAGIGRTGTMLACYLVSRGASSADAIREVRRRRPGSIETLEQERAITDFQKTVKIKRRKRK